MSKVTNFFKKHILLVLLILATIPAFAGLFRYGIHSMQDFHLFRLYEFDQCIGRLEIPCRWAADAGLGYGEPLFNFYGQFVYAVGELFYLAGFSLISSIKILFILSIVGSALGMFYLAKSIWKNNLGALLSAVLYTYAPYRAVDVWVRGALPEAFAFVFFPFIILSVERKNLFLFCILTFFLIITHNLSLVMFLPLLIVWIIYRKWWKGFYGFVISALLSAFYVLPVIFESKFINLESTTLGYFDFRAHFITLKQIFLDTSWGYGGSTWGSGDGLNLSVGILQWILPALVLVLILYKRDKISIQHKTYGILLACGFVYLLLTHNKTAFIWEALPFMKYIQFPWRFLGLAVFCFSLASGVAFVAIKNRLFSILIFVIVLSFGIWNLSFFKPDIWYSVDDSYFLTGSEWDRQRAASIRDYWPNLGHNVPSRASDGTMINYFPGWESSVEPEGGLIPKEGSEFKNTPVRTIGNIITLLALGFVIWKRKHL